MLSVVFRSVSHSSLTFSHNPSANDFHIAAPCSDAHVLNALSTCDVMPHSPAILILLFSPFSPFHNGIGIYCGAFMASFPISSPNHLMGATAALVMSSAPRAAMTAIQRIARARTFMMMVPIMPFPMSSALEAPFFASGSRSPMVVSVIPSPPQNLNVVVVFSVLISTTSDLSVPSACHPDAPMTSPRNISPKAKAADT